MRQNESKSSSNNTMDLDRLEPSDFYSEKREPKVNRFSLIEDKLNETKLNNLDDIQANNDQTNKIFSDVIKHDQLKKTQHSFEEDNITNEILQVDLDNDDTYVRDVFDEYDSSKIKNDEPSKEFSKSFDDNNDDDKLFDTDNIDSQDLDEPVNPTSKKSSLSDFVPTSQVNPVTKTKEIELEEDFNSDDKSKDKFHSVVAALEDASNNQDEIHKSIQIALDDVKKHEELDKEVKSAILRNVSTVPLTNNESDEIEEAAEEEEEPTVDELKTDFEVSDEVEEEPENDSATQYVYDEPDDEPKKIDEDHEVVDTKFEPHKKEYVFNFEDFKNAKTTTYNPPSFKKPELDEFPEEAKPSSLALNDLMLEKIKEYANQEVQKQMEIERAKLELERLNLSSTIENELSKNREAELAQLDIIEKAKKELEKERALFEEEKQAMADELMGVAKSERDVLDQERNAILSSAQKEKEALIESAKKEINLEREKLELEKQKLKASIAESIDQNQKYFDRQRDILLDAVEKEKTRLINQSKQKEIQDNQPNLVLQEVQDLIKEIRQIKGDNDQKYQELKEKLSEEARNSIKEAFNYAAKEKDLIASEVEKFSEEQKKKFDELVNELNLVKQQTLIRSPAAIPTTVISHNPNKHNHASELESEMEPITENRSYTEGPIDSIEIDDAIEEEPTNRKVYELQTVDMDDEDYDDNQPNLSPTNSVTSDINDVKMMRSALKDREFDFDFEEQRKIYEKEKVKEEIKKELLEEMTRMNGNTISIRPNDQRSIDEDLEELDTSFQDDSLVDIGSKEFVDIAGYQRKIGSFANRSDQDNLHEVGSIRLKSKETIPDLVDNNKPNLKENYKDQNKLYDLDLFDELGIDTYLDNDNMAIESIVNDFDKNTNNQNLQKPTAPVAQQNNFKPFKGRPGFFGQKKASAKPKFVIEKPQEQQQMPFVSNQSAAAPAAPKPKLRGAKMISENKFDNLSSKDLIKAYAQELLGKNKTNNKKNKK